MSQLGDSEPGKQKIDSTRKNLRRFFKVVILFAFLGSLLFLSSGQLDWIMAWVFLIGFVVGLFVTSTLLGSHREELIQERHNVPEGAKNWDQILSNSFSYLTLFVTLPIAGLDKRFNWTQGVGLTIQIISLLFALGGYALIIWAMVSNRFFSRIVRIQKDRGHSVISTGPYRFVRHPGYVGMLFFALATPLTLGSLWALIPGGMAAIIILLRTIFEDKTLLEELDGYEDYSKRVRSRLFPSLW